MLRFFAPISAGYGLLIALPDGAAAQGQNRPDQAQTPVTIEAKVGGKKYHASGSGECKHEADASIRGLPAGLWMVQYVGQTGALKQLNLTLWRPKDGSPDQISLAMETGSGSHRLQTGGKEGNSGEGRVTILPSGLGGRMKVGGRDAAGKSVQLTIDCPAFAGIEAEGG